MAEKIWFITGASRGFGRVWAEAALKRGDKVAATARTMAGLADLKEQFGEAVLPLELDVTDPTGAQQAIANAHSYFGRLDIVLNNAGYSLVSTIEEASEADIHALFETNFFGAVRVIQAALPLLRQQEHGHIIGVSSSLGLVTMPIIGFYCASKWAFEAMHESLAKEVSAFGIKVTMIEPGAFATEFGSPASLKFADGMGIYEDLRNSVRTGLAGEKRGDPQATPEAILAVVDAENPPLRFILGDQTLPMVRDTFAERIATWEKWATVSNAAQGESK